MSRSTGRRFSGRVLMIGAAATLSLLALACAPQGGGGGGGPVGPTTTTTTTSTLPWSTPTGTYSGFNLNCTFSVLGQYYDFQQFASVLVDAPTTVAPGQEFFIWVTPGIFQPPVVVQGNYVQNVNSFAIVFPLPANVEYLDANLTTGYNIGTGYPSVGLEAGYVVFRVPGPFAPGSNVQMPRIRIQLKATGLPGSTIQTSMDSLYNVAQFEAGAVGNSCWPITAGQVFSTTAIV